MQLIKGQQYLCIYVPMEHEPRKYKRFLTSKLATFERLQVEDDEEFVHWFRDDEYEYGFYSSKLTISMFDNVE